jgi:regulatory protein
MVGVAPGGASSFFTEALRSSTPSLPWLFNLLSPRPLRRRRVPDAGRLWHKNGAMARSGSSRPPPPLDSKRLQELALRYVGKYATSRAKLTSYLARKVRERGWSEQREPDFEAIAARFSELGYVDDAAYALAKSRSLSSRGYGSRRLDQKLRMAGIDEEDGAEARAHAEERAVDAALRYAERRRIGPFGSARDDPKQREKAIAAMVRAGHPFGLARAIASMAPGAEINREQLSG